MKMTMTFWSRDINTTVEIYSACRLLPFTVLFLTSCAIFLLYTILFHAVFHTVPFLQYFFLLFFISPHFFHNTSFHCFFSFVVPMSPYSTWFQSTYCSIPLYTPFFIPMSLNRGRLKSELKRLKIVSKMKLDLLKYFLSDGQIIMN